jgi:SAM-dependent methyltransferase
MSRDFDELVNATLAQEFTGWDFSYLRGRWRMEKLPWHYRALVEVRLQDAERLLDMGTGGGEFLASLVPLPPRTYASEGYAPNVPIACQQLEPLGVAVIEVHDPAALGLQSEYFDLVINRHESFIASEVYRVLRPGGVFITQQIGGRNNIELNEWLQDEIDFPYAKWSLARAMQQLEAAGFIIEEQQEVFPVAHFDDIGAVVFYLKVISWQIPDFSVERYRDKLRALHERIERSGPLAVRSHRFLVIARRL